MKEALDYLASTDLHHTQRNDEATRGVGESCRLTQPNPFLNQITGETKGRGTARKPPQNSESGPCHRPPEPTHTQHQYNSPTTPAFLPLQHSPHAANGYRRPCPRPSPGTSSPPTPPSHPFPPLPTLRTPSNPSCKEWSSPLSPSLFEPSMSHQPFILISSLPSFLPLLPIPSKACMECLKPFLPQETQERLERRQVRHSR